MSVDGRQIADTCRELWETTLGLNLADGAAQNGADENVLKSYVNVSGEWEGTVVVECSAAITQHAAAMMFGTDSDEMSGDDLQDALNELTRLVGKRIQTHLPAAGKLSAPKPLKGSEIAEMRGVQEVELNCEGRPVKISVFQSEAMAV